MSQLSHGVSHFSAEQRINLWPFTAKTRGKKGHFWRGERTLKHLSLKVTGPRHSQHLPDSFAVSVEKMGISAASLECSIWSLTLQIGRKAISARKWEGSDLWRSSKMILICQSESKSEIRKSGLQVKRHKEVRQEPRVRRWRRKRWWEIRAGNKRVHSVQIAGEREGGRCGVGNRLPLKKHTWVMKEKEGVQERKQVWLRQIIRRWEREREGERGEKERKCNGRRTSDFFLFFFSPRGRYQFRLKVNIRWKCHLRVGNLLSPA